MNQEQTTQWLLERMLDNLLFTPITVWLHLLNKMNSEELMVMVDIQKKFNAGELSEEDLDPMMAIVKKYIPEGLNRGLVSLDDEPEDEYIYIGLNSCFVRCSTHFLFDDF